MSVTRGSVASAIGAVVAVLLQVVVAPNIVLFSAMPNFIAAYVLVMAVVRPHNAGPVMPFLLGLAFDLLGGGPVGAMAFLLVLMSFVVSRAFALLDNDTLFMPLALYAAGMLAVEALYAALLMGLGMEASVLDAFVYRALPCALFDCIVGLILYPILARVNAHAAQQQQPGTTRLR